MHEFIDKESVDTSGQSVITALIDADSISYIVGWGHRDKEDADLVALEVDSFIGNILLATQARQYAGFFSPKFTFRNELYPEYKANRKPIDEGIAKWKPFIDEYLKQYWGFGEWPLHEADDAVSALQQNMVNTVVCGMDKDLKQIPGNHYNYKTGEKSLITPEMAEYNLYYQVLLGDSGDNIKGCPGVGKVSAKQVLDFALEDGELTLFGATELTFVNQCSSLAEAERLMSLAISLVHLTGYMEPQDAHLLFSHLHTFDLDAAGISSYISQSNDEQAAEDLFGDW